MRFGVSGPGERTKAQATVWLGAVLSALLVAATITAVLFVILGDGEGLLLAVAADIFFASLLLLVRRGRVQIASALLVLLLLMVTTLSVSTVGGVNAGAVTAYFLALSALLLSENAMLVVALLSVLALYRVPCEGRVPGCVL